MSEIKSVVAGTGMNVPERVVTNDYFASYLETSDQWIRERTGIVQRYWAEESVGTSELAAPAAEKAISNAGLSPQEIDGIVFATTTPDYIFPSSACGLQRRLGMKESSFAFDISAACSGFVFAVNVADCMIRSGQCQNLLVIGADVLSKVLDLNDRGTCVLFGDGAGAMVLRASQVGDADRQVFGSIIGSDGSHGEILRVPMGSAAPVSKQSIEADSHYLYMNGREVFKLAVRTLGDINKEIVEEFGFDAAEVDYYVSHQANKRILTATADRLGISHDKFPMNLDAYGNTSAATIPILLAELEEKGTLKQGQLVALSAFGAGVTWGANLIRW